MADNNYKYEGLFGIVASAIISLLLSRMRGGKAIGVGVHIVKSAVALSVILHSHCTS